MLSGLLLVQQAAMGNRLSFDPFPFDENGLASPEVDIGGRQVADALRTALPPSGALWSREGAGRAGEDNRSAVHDLGLAAGNLVVEATARGCECSR